MKTINFRHFIMTSLLPSRPPSNKSTCFVSVYAVGQFVRYPVKNWRVLSKGIKKKTPWTVIPPPLPPYTLISLPSNDVGWQRRCESRNPLRKVGNHVTIYFLASLRFFAVAMMSNVLVRWRVDETTESEKPSMNVEELVRVKRMVKPTLDDISSSQSHGKIVVTVEIILCGTRNLNSV